MKATEQLLPVVLFIMLYKVVLAFESVDKILKCSHSNESYCAVLSCCAVCFAIHNIRWTRTKNKLNPHMRILTQLPQNNLSKHATKLIKEIHNEVRLTLFGPSKTNQGETLDTFKVSSLISRAVNLTRLQIWRI